MKKLFLAAFIFCTYTIIFSIYEIDPLCHPDSIRYLNFANFLQNHNFIEGDLSGQQGLLFTPLFLPIAHNLLNFLFKTPFTFNGYILQMLSLLGILIMIFKLTEITADKKTAIFALTLLLIDMPFVMRSRIILTEYPFVFFNLAIIFLYIKPKTLDFKTGLFVFILGFITTSVRTQAIVIFILLIIYAACFDKKLLRFVLFILAGSLAYGILHLSLFNHLNSLYPNLLTLNEDLSLRIFILGDKAFDYSYTIAGIQALALPFAEVLSTMNFISYLRTIGENLNSYREVGLQNNLPQILLILIFCWSAFKAKIRHKSLFIFIVLGNLAMLTLGLVPEYNFLRYNSLAYPLAIIIIAAFFSKQTVNLRTNYVFFILISFYSLYLITNTYNNYKFFGLIKNNSEIVSNRVSCAISKAIQASVGKKQNILCVKTYYYGTVYRSGNNPKYFNQYWSKEEIIDYISKVKSAAILATNEEIAFLEKKVADWNAIGIKVLSFP